MLVKQEVLLSQETCTAGLAGALYARQIFSGDIPVALAVAFIHLFKDKQSHKPMNYSPGTDNAGHSNEVSNCTIPSCSQHLTRVQSL